MNDLSEAWRDFGVYFEYEPHRLAWSFRGSRGGIVAFCAALRDAAAPVVQLGPHRDLLLFEGEARILVEGIRGGVADRKQLASLIERKLARSEPGDEFQIDKQFAPMNLASIYVTVEDDDFDPAIRGRLS